jgi:hypothetical protein
MCHWQSEHDYSTCRMVLRYFLTVLLYPVDFYMCGHIKALLYAAPPWDSMRSSSRLIMDRRIRSEKPGYLRIVWQTFLMQRWSDSSLSTGTAYTRDLCVRTCKNPQNTKAASVEPTPGSSSTYPSAMLGVIENTSHSTAKMCRNTIMHVPHSCSDCQWYIFQWLW